MGLCPLQAKFEILFAKLKWQTALRNLKPTVHGTGTTSKYVIGLATVDGKENDYRIQKLNRMINNPKVKSFIEEKYKGVVLTVF